MSEFTNYIVPTEYRIHKTESKNKRALRSRLKYRTLYLNILTAGNCTKILKFQDDKFRQLWYIVFKV